MSDVKLAPIGVTQALKDQVYSMLKDAIANRDFLFHARTTKAR